jgi:NAD(P)-dependent dehydrogenase (short-subunit alcohol dehydrogenase family)
MARLLGRAAIITGGEGSIGMATSRAFVAEGASVLLAGISERNLKAGAAELGDRAAWTVTDVTDSAQVKAAVLMRTLAAELAPRAIRFNTIHPGPRSRGPCSSWPATTARS